MHLAIMVGCFIVFPIVSIIIDLARRRRRSQDPNTFDRMLAMITDFIALIILGACASALAIRGRKDAALDART